MPIHLRKWLNRHNVLSLVGIVLVILSVLLVPGRKVVIVPVEVEIDVDNPDEASLWITVDLLSQEAGVIQIVFPENSGYSVSVNREPKAVVSSYFSKRPQTVSVTGSGTGFWSFGEAPPEKKGARYNVKFQLENFLAPTHTGYVGIWRLKARAGTEAVAVFPALRASYHLTLSGSLPAPNRINTGRNPYEGAQMSPVEGFDYSNPKEPLLYYVYDKVKGEFVSKWEFFDSQRARDREVWLIFWSSLMGLGIGFFLEGCIVRLG